MLLKKASIFIIYSLLCSIIFAQELDTTFVIDGKLNAISPIDTNQIPAQNAIVGFPLRSYSDFVVSYYVYQLTVSGEVHLDEIGKKSQGPIVTYVDTQYGFTENWMVLTPNDTLEFIPGLVEDFYFHAYLFDPDTIGDNSGQFYVKLDVIGWVRLEEGGETPVSNFELTQNYPNPFNSNTIIRYSIEKSTLVEINIYNILGEKVKSLLRKNNVSGVHSVEWNGADDFGEKVNSGVYFYQIRAGNQLKTQRMIYLK